ncbi:hypothetical protein G9A89_005277 [Geosiphon pyriformis]|nr:hypothetical protein G9A89_005277 [Geosiphon pyriformis]
MSGTGAKKRSIRVPTSGSVSSGSSHKIKKPSSGAKLSNNGATLKGSGSGQVVGQFNSIDTDKKASEGKGVSDSKINTLQAKHFNNSVIIGSLFGSINYDMEEKKEISLPFHKSFSLDKAWIDPKVIKTQVEVAVKKSFTLDINLSAMKRKSATVKIHVIRKLFLVINGFGRAITPSKFEEIIRSTFTSEASMEKATSLARENNIIAIAIKKISIDTPKEMIITAVSKFGQIKLIKIQLIGLWQKAVVEFAELKQAVSLAAKDQFKTLLFTLPVGTTVYNLGNLLDGASRKSCIINHSLETGNRFRCAVVGFEFNEMLESAFHTEPILGVGRLYAKKDVPIARLVAFGSKLWVQVVSLILSSNNSHFGFDPGFGSLSSGASDVIGLSPHMILASTSLEACLASLEHSVEFLVDKISGIVSKLDNLVLVPSTLTFSSQNLVVSVMANVGFDSDMALDDPKPVLFLSPLVLFSTSDLGSSSSRILTSKVDCLKSKLMALEASVCSVLEKLDQMCTGLGFAVSSQADIIHWHKDINNMISIVTETKLRCKFSGVRVFISGLNLGYLGSGVAIIMDVALAKHMYRISEVPGCLLAFKLFFKNKLSVSVLGLYAGTSMSMCFSQADEINALIADAVNESSFVILGSNFNEDGFRKSASFKKCGTLGLVNSLVNSVFLKVLTWSNSWSVIKTIDYLFVSSNLVNAIVDRSVLEVSGFFDTDHQSVLMSVGLGGLLDMHLCLLRKQSKFKEAIVANSALFTGGFLEAKECLDLNAMWDAIHRTMCFLANEVFKKIWFKEYDRVFTKCSSRFHRLELLVFKLVKASRLVDYSKFVLLLDIWDSFDSINAFVVRSLFLSGFPFNSIRSILSKVRKSYHASKLLESKCTENFQIRSAINKKIESFESNKDYTIRSVLERPFCKVVLNHLVVGDEMILESDPVKSKMDEIIEVLDVNNEWSHQYQPLEYVFDDAFADTMGCVNFDVLFSVVSDLLDGKTTELLGISNKLWKNCDKSVLDMLLVLINFCFSSELVPISMIPKPHKWEGVLMNTHPIVLIETAHKIFSKILSNRISLVCSKFDVLCGDNFFILKGTMTQSLIFAIDLVVKDALKKNRKLWLAYDSVGWEHLEKSLVRIKMCGSFIRFFKCIHVGCTNQIMTDFGLTDGYHDEVFFPLLWHIFYNPLLCKIKRQESVYGYRLVSHYILKNGCAESQAGLSLFLATSAFVNDTI